MPEKVPVALFVKKYLGHYLTRRVITFINALPPDIGRWSVRCFLAALLFRPHACFGLSQCFVLLSYLK
jgi:hypothetical protein